MSDVSKFGIAIVLAWVIGFMLGFMISEESYKDELKQLEKQKLELEIKKLKNQLNNL